MLGLIAAVALGYLIYKGALRLNLSTFFTVTGAFLIVVAASVLSSGIHDLQEARFLPGLHSLIFDVSAQIPTGSMTGTLLKGIFNFSPATTWLAFVVWWAYVLPTGFLFWRKMRSHPAAPTPTTTAVVTTGESA